MTDEEKLEAQIDKVRTTLATMLDYLGLEAGIKVQEKASKIAVIVTSEDAGRIIGRKGQSLESLQLLLNRMMLKSDNDFPKVHIDIDGYSKNRPSGKGRDNREGGRGGRGERGSRGGDRRQRSSQDEETLKQQALDAAKEVKRWGESVTLPAMNSHDRRLIHITLKEDAEITTESEGEGSRKNVVISLKK